MGIKDLMSMAEPKPQLTSKLLAKLKNYKPLNCFRCMRCSSGCTSLKLLELKPHEIANLVKLELIEELINSGMHWTCATCLKCKERCPQKVTPYDIIMALRNQAVELEAKVPEAYMQALSQILETGLMQPLQKVSTRQLKIYGREELGLPAIRYPSDQFKQIFLRVLEEASS